MTFDLPVILAVSAVLALGPTQAVQSEAPAETEAGSSPQILELYEAEDRLSARDLDLLLATSTSAPLPPNCWFEYFGAGCLVLCQVGDNIAVLPEPCSHYGG